MWLGHTLRNTGISTLILDTIIEDFVHFIVDYDCDCCRYLRAYHLARRSLYSILFYRISN